MARFCKLLVIDDSLFIQSAIRETLASTYELFFECSGEAALDFLCDHTVDLIILDINMAGIDGCETLRRLKEAGQTAPVLVLTSDPKNMSEKKVLDLGAAGYITKPFDKNELKKVIAVTLEQKRR